MAKRRLLRDLHEIQTDPLSSVIARPLDNNIYQWHGNLKPDTGPYAGTIFHLILTFPENYPFSPPSVKLCTQLEHPNIFGDYICLDMLKNNYNHSDGANSGWTTAYSVQSILLQMQAFLFDENVPQEYGGSSSNRQLNNRATIERTKASAKSLRCTCGHRDGAPWPPHQQQKKPQTNVARTPGGQNYFPDLPDELVNQIFEQLTPQELYRVTKLCKQFARLSSKYCLQSRQGLMCFHSKRNHHEETLGVGINRKYYPDSKRIDSLTSPLDILSYTAYVENVRLSVWREPFEFFLPMIINPAHAEKSKRAFFTQLATIHESIAKPSDPVGLGRLVWNSIPKLMNSTTVSLMKPEVPKDTKEQSWDDYDYNSTPPQPNAIGRFLSEVALQGYCTFHHMLLYHAAQLPSVVNVANGIVSHFVNNPDERKKSAVPNLGEFLVALTLSDVKWDRVAPLLIEEFFDRNVKWLLESFPMLESIEVDTISPFRIRSTWKSSTVGCRIIMFQVYFLFAIGRPDGKNWREVLTTYNQTLGRPSNAAQEKLHKACKTIMEIDNWEDFFTFCRVKPPTPAALTKMLKGSIMRSREKGYHRPPRGNFSRHRPHVAICDANYYSTQTKTGKTVVDYPTNVKAPEPIQPPGPAPAVNPWSVKPAAQQPIAQPKPVVQQKPAVQQTPAAQQKPAVQQTLAAQQKPAAQPKQQQKTYRLTVRDLETGKSSLIEITKEQYESNVTPLLPSAYRVAVRDVETGETQLIDLSLEKYNQLFLPLLSELNQ